MVVILGGVIEWDQEGGNYAPKVGSCCEQLVVGAGRDDVRGVGSCAPQQLSAHQGLFAVQALRVWG